MRGDQASTLREIRRRENTGAPSRRLGRPHLTDAVPGEIRVLSVTSGKGGVGKTNIAANLAYLLSRANKKTLILDADAGLANIDVILGIHSRYNLSHVLNGERSLDEVIVPGPGGIQIGRAHV